LPENYAILKKMFAGQFVDRNCSSIALLKKVVTGCAGAWRLGKEKIIAAEVSMGRVSF
jgi:hypothetical protein